MKHPYSKLYVEDVQKRVSVLFQYSYDELGFSLEKILSDFVNSKLAWGIEQGLPYYMVHKAGTEMVEFLYPEVVVDDDKLVRYGQEYWVGWVLPYLEWYSGLSFKKIVEIIPAERFYVMYRAYHEMDISHLEEFADEFLIKQ